MESCQAISLDKLITDLNLSSNRLGLESSGAVRDLLKLNRLIERLDLSCNNLTLDGGNNILEGLKYNTSIKYLDVRYMELSYCPFERACSSSTNIALFQLDTEVLP